MFSKNRTIFLVVLLAAFLRFYQLGSNPPSLDWDEASLGYNAYSILKTGKDEYGNTLPLSIRSFNDYKPPAYVYLTVPAIALFGLNEFSVRLPSAIAGIISVIVLFHLVLELFKSEKNKFLIATTSALLLAISPWHLQFSRIAFEANLALFFFMLAVFFLIRSLNSKSSVGLVLASIVFSLTMYTYHSARLVVPVFLLVFAVFNLKKITEIKTKAFVAFLVGIILLTPLGITLLRGSLQARFSTVSVFTNPGIFTKEQETIDRQAAYKTEDFDSANIFSVFHRPKIVLTKLIAQNYFDHFNLSFLFIRGDGIGRHSAVGSGLLYYWELPFLIAGAFLLLSKKRDTLTLLAWLIAAPSAAALTTQTPHAVRSLMMLPVLSVTVAYAVVHFVTNLRQKRLLLGFFGLIVIANLIYYLNLYYIHTPAERSQDWQYGYKQLVEKLASVSETVDEIIVTTSYDQPYVYFLFYDKVDPAWYQTVAEHGSQGFAKLIFRKINYQRDINLKNTIIVGTPEEIPSEAEVFAKILFLNNQEAFLLVKS